MARTPAHSGTDQRMIGKTVAGRYSLVRLLGDGGMGAVYKAEDNVLRRFVAVKLLHPAAAANPAAVERFLREAQSAASIGHPNIIDILDFGQSEGKPYLVMEYLRGRSLADQLATEGPYSIRQACAIATHALAGLQGAHDRGILHRDLKPANLMLVPRFGDRTFVKLLDFGFAALLGEETAPGDRSLTPARTLVGTPAYAAPERLRGDDRRDPRTDLYAIGVVLFEMLAGVRPFDASSFSELARKVQNDAPPALRLYRPDAPEALERVIARALAKKPEDRFPDAESFAAALVPFGGRMVENDDSVSDSLSTDLLKIRARERRQAPTGQSQPPGRGPNGTLPGRQRTATKTDSDDLAIDRIALDVGPKAWNRNQESAPEPGPQGGRPGAPSEAAAKAGARVQTKAGPSPAQTKAGPSPMPPLPKRPPSAHPSSIPEETIRMNPGPLLGLEAAAPAKPPPRPSPAAPAASAAKPAKSSVSRAQPAAPARPGRSAPHAVPPPPFTRAPEGALRPPTREDADAALSRKREVEASVGLAVLRFASHRYGERAVASVLAALPEQPRSVFTAGLSPGSFVPFESLCELVEAIDRNLGRDDLHLVADCGRAVADGTAERLHEPGQPFPPPELLLAEMPRYLGTMLRGVRCRVRSIGRGYGRIELDELSAPASLTLCVVVLGILDRTLGRFGAREVEVNMLNCRYLGDDENLFDISWLIT
jgi:serine/threonine protein kinase